MNQTIRTFLVLEAASFLAASLIHSGDFITGYEHAQARTAEGVIAVVLLTGLMLTFVWPEQTRLIGMVSQGFALLGTMVGLFTIAVGVGPRTVPDVIYHAAIVIVLVWGLITASRARLRV